MKIPAPLGQVCFRGSEGPSGDQGRLWGVACWLYQSPHGIGALGRECTSVSLLWPRLASGYASPTSSAQRRASPPRSCLLPRPVSSVAQDRISLGRADWEAPGAASSTQDIWVCPALTGLPEESLSEGLFRLGVTLEPSLVTELDSKIRFKALEGPLDEQMSSRVPFTSEPPSSCPNKISTCVQAPVARVGWAGTLTLGLPLLLSKN